MAGPVKSKRFRKIRWPRGSGTRVFVFRPGAPWFDSEPYPATVFGADPNHDVLWARTDGGRILALTRADVVADQWGAEGDEPIPYALAENNNNYESEVLAA